MSAASATSNGNGRKWTIATAVATIIAAVGFAVAAGDRFYAPKVVVEDCQDNKETIEKLDTALTAKVCAATDKLDRLLIDMAVVKAWVEGQERDRGAKDVPQNQ